MMNTVTLCDDGRLIAEGRPVDNRPLTYLNARVQLAEDFTLRGFFRMMGHYPVFSELNVFLDACLEQYRACPPRDCRDPSLDSVTLTKTVEMIGFPGDPRLDIYHSLYGLQGDTQTEIRFFTMEMFLDVPLKLGKLKHVIFGDKMDMFEFDTVFTLFELIDAIAWELSFHGSLQACEIRR